MPTTCTSSPSAAQLAVAALVAELAATPDSPARSNALVCLDDARHNLRLCGWEHAERRARTGLQHLVGFRVDAVIAAEASRFEVQS